MATGTQERLPEGVERIRAANPGPLTLGGTNTWLIGSPAWVIDPGPADEAHLEAVWRAAAARGGVAGIVLTHRHADHGGAAPALRERARAPLAAGPAPDAAGPFAEPEAEGVHVDRILREGDRFGPLEAIETPGHSPDHISLLERRGGGGIAFCGDTVLGEGSVFVAPGGDSLRRYLDSLRKLERLDLDALCPGHGPVVTDPRRKLLEYLEHRLDRERRLRSALERGLRTRVELLDEVWDDAPAALRPAAALTLEAHLEKLEREDALPEGVERLRSWRELSP